MRLLLAIATNTFREAIRDRVLYSILFFAAGVLFLSLAVSEITIGDGEKVVRSVAQGAIRLFTSGIALFLGVGLVYKELERKTIYTIASKPIPRWLFLLGKYAGLMAVLAVELLLLGSSTWSWDFSPPGLCCSRPTPPRPPPPSSRLPST